MLESSVAAGQDALAADIVALSARFNRSQTTFAVPGSPLEVVISR